MALGGAPAGAYPYPSDTEVNDGLGMEFEILNVCRFEKLSLAERMEILSE